MSQRILECSGPINVGVVVSEINNKLDLRTGGSISGSVTINNDFLKVDDGTNFVELVNNSVTLNDGTNEGIMKINSNNNTIEFSVNSNISLEIHSSSPPSSQFQPTKNDQLTRKDYVDSLANLNIKSVSENGIGLPLDNMIVLTKTEYLNLTYKNPTTFYVIMDA